MAKKSFKCSKCDRSFSMAAHLARHMNAIHVSAKKKAAAKRKRKAKKAGKAKRVKRGRTAKVRAPARRKRATGRKAFRDMTLEQLTRLIASARKETRRRLTTLEALLA